MTTFPLSDPAAADAFLASSGLSTQLDGFPAGTPLGLARFGQIALVLGEPELMAGVLAGLEGSSEPLARGVRMMIQAQLGDYAAVLSTDPSPLGCQPLELEDAAHAQAAASVAHAQSGNFSHAISNLVVAIALGQATGMSNRVSIMEFERERLYSLQGQARPDELRRLLLAPMSERRRAWGRRTWAEALMSLGDHQTALRALGHPSTDQPADLALRAFLHLALSLPLPELSEAAGHTPYGQLVRLAGRMDPHALHAITGEPQRTYAALMEGLALILQPETRSQGLRVIGVTAPQRADQALLHALIWLAALAQGADHPRPQDVFQAVATAHDLLRSTQYVMNTAQQVMPELSVLLALSGHYPGLDIRIMGLPLLIGSEVLMDGARHALPGRTGRVLVCEALGLPEKPLGREEMKRVKCRLGAIGAPRPVNMGQVLLMARGLGQCAAEIGDASLVSVWQTTADRITGMLTRDTLDVLAMHQKQAETD